VEDITVAGVTIPAGDAIVTTFAAAGHDPPTTATPPRNSTRRAPRATTWPSVSVCTLHRRPLARMEAITALPALFERYEGLSLAVDPAELRQVPSFVAIGWEEIPIRLG